MKTIVLFKKIITKNYSLIRKTPTISSVWQTELTIWRIMEFGKLNEQISELDFDENSKSFTGFKRISRQMKKNSRKQLKCVKKSIKINRAPMENWLIKKIFDSCVVRTSKKYVTIILRFAIAHWFDLINTIDLIASYGFWSHDYLFRQKVICCAINWINPFCCQLYNAIRHVCLKECLVII